MKLCVCIVHNRDKGRITDELVKKGFKFTVIGSTGGFLREGNTTFLIGCEDDEKNSLFGLIRQNCKSREQLVSMMPLEVPSPGPFMPDLVKVPVGGAVVFVLPVDQFERF